MDIDRLVTLEKIRKFIVGLVCVPKCVGCGELISVEKLGHGEHVLCEKCRRTWEKAKMHTCTSCMRSYTECTCPPEILIGAGCGTLVSLVPYKADEGRTGVVNRVIYRIKNEYDSELTDFLAKELSFRIFSLTYEIGLENILITYSPRSSSAIRRYGHDQSEKLAKRLAHQLGCKCVRLVSRVGGRKSHAQKELNTAERVKNAYDSFEPAKKVSEAYGKCVIVVDDIATTGASLAAATRILKDAGAMSVLCVTVAKTVKKDNEKMKESEADDICLNQISI